MKEYIIEFKAYWSDGVVDEEQTINIDAESLEEATKLGKQTLNDMDENSNRFCDCVTRHFYRCVEADKFTYLSSVKEDTGIYKDAGYIDITRYP